MYCRVPENPAPPTFMLEICSEAGAIKVNPACDRPTESGINFPVDPYTAATEAVVPPS